MFLLSTNDDKKRLTKRILAAREDPQQREELLREQDFFIRRCASKAAGRSIGREEEAYAEAMLAFDDAVMKYTPLKGDFWAFAARSIRNRVIDCMRKENRQRFPLPFSSLERETDGGETIPFEAEDPRPVVSEVSLEIEALSGELAAFGLSFWDLPKASPKTRKTRSACLQVIRCLCETGPLCRQLLEKKRLPGGELLAALHINDKLLERHRAYIIAGVLISRGGYEVLRDYLYGSEE